MEERIYINIRERERQTDRQTDRQTEIYMQIIILLKLSLLDMHLKGNTMSIYGCICTHNVGKNCIFNMPNIPPLFNFNNL